MRVIDVERLHDIRLTLPDPSAIAGVAQLLARAHVNIDSVCCEAADRAGAVTCRLLVSDGPGAQRTLAAAGVAHEMHDVAAFTLQNRPGTLAAVVAALNTAEVRIDFLYQATMKGLVIGAADVEAVIRALFDAQDNDTTQAVGLAATG